MQRVGWIDSAKGFAILLVVLGHTWDGLGTRGLIEPSLHQPVYDHLYAYHMPFFFMLSSFFISSSLLKAELKPFVWKQFWQMIYPMVIWYYIFLSAKIIAGGFANEAGSAAMFSQSPIPGKWLYWFLWALFLMRTTIFLMRPVLRNSRYFDAIIISFIIGLIILDKLPQSEWVSFWFSPAISFGPYFLFGILLGKYNEYLMPHAIYILVALVIFLSLALLVSYLNSLGITKFPIAIAMCLCSIFIFKWLEQQSGFLRKLMSIFATLGILSMPIYLAHPIFSSFAREVLVLAGFTSISVQFIIGTIMGVVCSLLLYHLSVKLKLNVLFGFDVPKNKIGVYFRSRMPL